MKVNTQVILLVRSEVEKTPKIVTEQEAQVMRELHGENNILTADIDSPIGAIEIDPEAEYQRLLNEYQQADGKPHPVMEVFKNFNGFLKSLKEKPKAD